MSRKRKQREPEWVAESGAVVDLDEALERRAQWHYARLTKKWDEAPDLTRQWFAREMLEKELAVGVLDHAEIPETDCSCATCASWRQAQAAAQSAAQRCATHPEDCSCADCLDCIHIAESFRVKDTQSQVFAACAVVVRLSAEAAMNEIWENIFVADRGAAWWRGVAPHTLISDWLPKPFGGR